MASAPSDACFGILPPTDPLLQTMVPMSSSAPPSWDRYDGVIRTTPEDFIVREVDPDGVTVPLSAAAALGSVPQLLAARSDASVSLDHQETSGGEKGAGVSGDAAAAWASVYRHPRRERATRGTAALIRVDVLPSIQSAVALRDEQQEDDDVESATADVERITAIITAAHDATVASVRNLLTLGASAAGDAVFDGTNESVVVGAFSDKERRGTARCTLKHHCPSLVFTFDGPVMSVTADVQAFLTYAKVLGVHGTAGLVQFCIKSGMPGHDFAAAFSSPVRTSLVQNNTGANDAAAIEWQEWVSRDADGEGEDRTGEEHEPVPASTFTTPHATTKEERAAFFAQLKKEYPYLATTNATVRQERLLVSKTTSKAPNSQADAADAGGQIETRHGAQYGVVNVVVPAMCFRRTPPKEGSRRRRLQQHLAANSAAHQPTTEATTGGGKRSRDGDSADAAAKTEEGTSTITSTFTHYVMKKRALDASTAKSLVARFLGVSPTDIGMAGTKDKRAVTAQRISVLGDQHPLDTIGRLIDTGELQAAMASLSDRRSALSQVMQNGQLEDEDAVTSSSGSTEALHRDLMTVRDVLSAAPIKVWASPDGGAFVELYCGERRGTALELGESNGNRFTVGVAFPQPHGEAAQEEDGGPEAELNEDAGIKSPNELTVGVLTERVEQIKSRGFVNFFGPQRFGVPASMARGHPGVELLRGDFKAAVAAVCALTPDEAQQTRDAKSFFLSKGCDPAHAAAALRMAPRNTSDFTTLLIALKDAVHRRSKKAQRSTNTTEASGEDDEVERDAVMAMPFAVKQMWLHAAQSLIFNVAASIRTQGAGAGLVPVPGDFVSDAAGAGGKITALKHGDDSSTSHGALLLPLIGARTQLSGVGESSSASVRQALAALGVTLEMLTAKGQFCGVPLKGTMRPIYAVPSLFELTAVNGAACSSLTGPGAIDEAVRQFTIDLQLPSSCYATVALRAVLGAFPANSLAPVGVVSA